MVNSNINDIFRMPSLERSKEVSTIKEKISPKYYSWGKVSWDGVRHWYRVSTNGGLFSKGRYPTKISVGDLPEWFVEGHMYHHVGFLSAKGVKDLYYMRSNYTNHLYKDDLLYISYGKPISHNSNGGFPDEDGYDYVISGWMIIQFIKAVDKYSDIDTAPIKQALNDKLAWYYENWDVHCEVPEGITDIFSF